MRHVQLTEAIHCAGDSGSHAVIPPGVYDATTGEFDSGPSRDEMEIMARGPNDPRDYFYYVPLAAKPLVYVY